MSFILAIFLLLLTPNQARGQIIINEVFPAPKQGNEWIELYNPSNQEIDLEGWWLEDQLSSPTIIARIENEALPSLDYLVIELSSAKLNNSADGVVLKNPQAEIIDQMSYQKSESDLSWARNNSGIFELVFPTQNSINIFPSPSPSPSPSSSPKPSPATPPIKTDPKINESNPTLTTPETLPTPPVPPSLPYLPRQLVLSFDSTISATPNKLTRITTKKPPKEALLSVILGGSWLLFSSSWKIHEKISQQRQNS